MKNKKNKLNIKKKSIGLRKKIISTRIHSVQKEYNKISALLLKLNKNSTKDKKFNDLKIYKEDLDFQLQVLLEKLKTSPKIILNKKYGNVSYDLIKSSTFDSLTIPSSLEGFKELSQELKWKISDNLKELITKDLKFDIKPFEQQETLDLQALNLSKTTYLNKYFAMMEEHKATEYIRNKALSFLKESKEYGYRFQEVNDYSVLDKIQTKALDQLMFELKSNLSIEHVERENQPYYELFKRILRFLEKDNSLKHIKEELPEEFRNLLLVKTEKKDEDERMEYLIITTISVIATAFSNVMYRSYLDLCLLVGEHLCLLLNPKILFERLDKIQKTKTNINVQQQVKETLKEYAQKMKVEQPLDITYKIGNLMIISFLKAGLLAEVFQNELIDKYNKEYTWYKDLTPEQKEQFLKEHSFPKPGNVLTIDKLKEIIEQIPMIKYLYAYNLPSIAKPVSYYLNKKDGTINYGGFISNEFLHREPLVKKDSQQRTLTVLEQDFLDARNYLQGKPFSISIPVLKYLINLYKQKTLFQSTDDTVKQSQVLYSLEVALHLLLKDKDNEFYAPVSLDFRARVYEICTLLSYQGPDICRMLFTTPESYVLDQKTIKLIISLCAISYNKAYRNKDLTEHLTFFIENMDLIHKTGYLCDFNKLKHVNKKYDFVKLCILIRELKFFEELPVNSLGKWCNMLISLDAKSSGLQLISLLRNSRSLCEKVHIVESKEETEDIYSYVAEKINTFITINLDDFSKKYPKYLFFNDKKERIFYTRNIWKKIIMIKGYAAGFDKLLMTFKVALLEQYPHIKESIWSSHKIDIQDFFSEILAQLSKLLPEISEFLSLCFNISTDAYKKKVPLKWKTLNKTAEIQHIYNEIKEVRYVSSYQATVMRLNVNLYQKDTFANKNKWAFPANLIQSCDATLLECILLEAKKQNITITSTAHDCILIKISDYWKVQDLVSTVIKNLFTYENVRDFWQQFRPYIKEEHLKLFDKKTQIDKETFEKLINDVSKNKTLFVLG